MSMKITTLDGTEFQLDETLVEDAATLKELREINPDGVSSVEVDTDVVKLVVDWYAHNAPAETTRVITKPKRPVVEKKTDDGASTGGAAAAAAQPEPTPAEPLPNYGFDVDWTVSFLRQIDLEMTMKLILSLNYLGNKSLFYRLMCYKLALVMRSKTAEELTDIFGLEEGFFDDEDRDMLEKERKWTEESKGDFYIDFKAPDVVMATVTPS